MKKAEVKKGKKKNVLKEYILLSHCLVFNGYLWAVGWAIQSFLVSPA